MCTIPNINEELTGLDEAINNKLIQSLTDKKVCVNHERLLLLLPAKLGGMGIPIFFRNLGNRISKPITTNRRAHIINITTRKNMQNLKRNHGQHQEGNLTGKTRI